MAIAARIPMIATTTSSSISVKPFDFFRFILVTLLMLPPFGWCCGRRCAGAVSSPGKSKRGATRAPRTRHAAPGRGSYIFAHWRPGVRDAHRHDVRRPRHRNDAASLHHRAELEDRQVHRDPQAADHHAEEDDDRRLETRHGVRHRVLPLVLLKGGIALQ